MDTFFYFKSLRRTIIQFQNIFNNIKIAKYDASGTVTEYVTVPLKLAPKEKFYNGIYDRKHEKKLPMMASYISSLAPASTERGVNKFVKIPTGNSIRKNFVPYNIEFNLSIATKYINEADQILEQILPYFDPYVFVRIQLPEVSGYFDAKVILNNVTPEIETDIAEDMYRTVKGDLGFTVHSYLLKPLTDTNRIKEIYLQLKNYDFYETPSLSGDGLFETLYLSGYKDDSANIIYNYEIDES